MKNGLKKVITMLVIISICIVSFGGTIFGDANLGGIIEGLNQSAVAGAMGHEGFGIGADGTFFSPQTAVNYIMDQFNTPGTDANNLVLEEDGLYTTDNSNFKSPPEFKCGTNYDTNISMGIATLAGGEKIESISMIFQPTEFLNSSELSDRYSKDYADLYAAFYNSKEPGISEDAIEQRLAESAQNFADGANVSNYANIASYMVSVECSIDADGTLIIKVPPDFPSNLMVATKIEINGKTYDLAEFQYVYVVSDGEELDPSLLVDKQTPEPPDPEPEPPDTVEADIGADVFPEKQNEYKWMNPSASGKITHEEYDVATSIPTSEYLDFEASAANRLYYIEDRTQTAKAWANNITVKGTAIYQHWCTCGWWDPNYKWKDSNGKQQKGMWFDDTNCPYYNNYHYDTITHSEVMDFEAYSKAFWDVPISNTYSLTRADITLTPTLVDGNIKFTGGGTAGPQTTTVIVQKPKVNKEETNGSGVYTDYNKAKAAAESAFNALVSDIQSRVDACVDEGRRLSVINPCNYSYGALRVTKYDSNGTDPGHSIETGYDRDKLIPSDKENGNYISSGRVYYTGGKSGVFKPNDVFIHTPVVNKTEVKADTEFINQKVNKESHTYLMLDETFTVTVPNNGTHKNAKGYGTRDYNSNQAVPGQSTNWGKIKDVKFPFDVYMHTGNTRRLIKAGTWLSDIGGIDLSGSTHTFTIPVWAQEGKGKIETRVVAENEVNYTTGTAYNAGRFQENANIDPNNYVATKNIDVEVIGKIYDLRISATNDPGWTNIVGEKGNYVTAGEFPFGQAGQNKVTAYKFAPKVGYIIEFDFKTKGIKSDNVDVSVQPEGFYFVPKAGGTATPVDLFYNTTSQKYIKIEPSDTKIPLVTNLSNSFMKVSKQELIDSTRIMIQKLKAPYTYAQNVNIGSFPRLNLPENLRLCYNNFAEYIGNGLYKKTAEEIIEDATNGHKYSTGKWDVLAGAENGKDVVIGSVGHWYAGYRLPASTMAVPVGTTAAQIANDPTLIKNGGYILIKFNIRTKYKEWDYLEYIGPEALNESGKPTGKLENDEGGNPLDWTKDPINPSDLKPTETQEIKLPNGNTAKVPIGTVAIIETDLRAYQDFETEGTH